MNPFDRIMINIGGQRLSARPIEFDFENGLPICATKFETTCPTCGQCVQFYGVVESVQCQDCLDKTIASDKLEINKNVIVVNLDRKKEMMERMKGREMEKIGKSPIPFVDPIALGLFSIDGD